MCDHVEVDLLHGLLFANVRWHRCRSSNLQTKQLALQFCSEARISNDLREDVHVHGFAGVFIVEEVLAFKKHLDEFCMKLVKLNYNVHAFTVDSALWVEWPRERTFAIARLS